LAFSPDSQRLATASWDQTVKAWDAQNSQEAFALRSHIARSRPPAAFSPDGKRLASPDNEDKTVTIWDTENGPGTPHTEGNHGYMSAVAYSPDGRRLAEFAGWAIGGALLGLTVVFACVTEAVEPRIKDLQALFFGMLSAFAVYFLLWGILEKLAGLSEAITVERDGGTALRLSAFLPALGLLLAGRALPSQGKGVPYLLANGQLGQHLFLLCGPFALLLVAIPIERWRRENAQSAGCGPKVGDVVIGLFYLAGAGLWTYLSR
jgi:hypothetical protein